MTCIVGLVHEDKIYMGGDSAGVGGLDLNVRGDVKVFKNKGYVMGFTSSFRMGQILRYDFKPPSAKDVDPKSLEKHMVQKFIPALKAAFKDHWWNEDEAKKQSGGVFLVGVKGRLFKIYSDFQVAHNLEPFDACGCGEPYALGAMDILFKDTTLSPKEKIERALKSAETFSGGVRGPFTIVKK